MEPCILCDHMFRGELAPSETHDVFTICDEASARGLCMDCYMRCTSCGNTRELRELHISDVYIAETGEVSRANKAPIYCFWS